MNINLHIMELIQYAISKNMIQTVDFDYTYNRLTTILKCESHVRTILYKKEVKQLSITLNLILDYASDSDLFSPNTLKNRDIYESMLMDVFSSLPSDLNRKFYDLLDNKPERATDFFYKLSKDNNYIKNERIARNINWKSTTTYGIFDMTINLSKPEKDPRDIITDLTKKNEDYPLCLLCKENVGFYGNSSRPGRSNHRVIKLNLNNEEFYLQYSPYVYYNEHSIVFMKEHLPMNFSEKTYKRLFDFVDLLPHYFLGSNAGLPIVGGSILSHEHYQGGRHHFPIQDAKEVKIDKIGNVSLKYLIWPISVLRLESTNKADLVKMATKIYDFWRNYSDKAAGIVSYTDAPHNAITPIARKNGSNYTLDIALRNNLTSKDYPLGVFHSHKEHHNIKKENIGLIEVMGLAVLPARLKNELVDVKYALKNNESLPIESSIHKDWLQDLKSIYEGENIDLFIHNQVTDKFVKCLEDSGVFKQTPEGINSFKKFNSLLVDELKK